MLQVGNLVWISGALCLRDGELTHQGFVGEDLTIEEGSEAARVCALNLLAVLKDGLGDLERVVRVVALNGYVQARDGFPDSPVVLNGASDLFAAVFGERGRHTRAAVGVSGLPKGAAVEIQGIFEIHP